MNNDNVNFLIEEKMQDTNTNTNTNYDINFLIEEKMQDMLDTSLFEEEQCSNELAYFIDKFLYSSDELFYEKYTVKELLDICQYYEIDNYIKKAKYKKAEIIDAIIYFESVPENFEIIKKRHTMWAYMVELTNDPKMRKYIII